MDEYPVVDWDAELARAAQHRTDALVGLMIGRLRDWQRAHRPFFAGTADWWENPPGEVPALGPYAPDPYPHYRRRWMLGAGQEPAR